MAKKGIYCLNFKASKGLENIQKAISKVVEITNIESEKKGKSEKISFHYIKTIIENYIDKSSENLKDKIDNYNESDALNLVNKVISERNKQLETSITEGEKYRKDLWFQNDILGKRLHDTINKLGIDLEFSDKILDNNVKGIWNDEKKLITMSADATFEDVKHEMIHAVTRYYLHYNDDYLKDLQSKDVLMPIGTSGSGKSTWIKSLPNSESYTIISPDEMRVEFTGDINNKSKDDEIYKEAAIRAVKSLKKGKKNIFDTTNLKKDRRESFINEIYKYFPNAKIAYKLMPLNGELAKQRITKDIAEGKNRANVSPETIDRHVELYSKALKDIKNEKPTILSEPKQLPKNIQNAIKDIEDSYNLFKSIVTSENSPIKIDDVVSNEMYGITSVDEFIAELSNPIFRQYIRQVDKSLQDLGYVRNKEEGILQKIINAIREFFGLSNNLRLLPIERSAVNALDTLMTGYDIEVLNQYSKKLTNRRIINQAFANTLHIDNEKLTEDVDEISISKEELSSYKIGKDQVITNMKGIPFRIKGKVKGNYIFQQIKNIEEFNYSMWNRSDGENRLIATIKTSPNITSTQRSKLKSQLTTKQINERRNTLARLFDDYVRNVIRDVDNGFLTEEESKTLTDEQVIAKLGVDNIFNMIKADLNNIRRNATNSNIISQYDIMLDEDNFEALKNLALGKSLLATRKFLNKHRTSGENIIKEDAKELNVENEESEEENAELETEAESVNGFEYDKSAGEESLFKNANKETKIFLNTIEDGHIDENGKVDKEGNSLYVKHRDELGLPKFIDLMTAYSTLQHCNLETSSPEDFLNNIKEKSHLSSMGFLANIARKLETNKDLLNTVYSSTKGVILPVIEVLKESDYDNVLHVNTLNNSNNTNTILRQWRLTSTLKNWNNDSLKSFLDKKKALKNYKGVERTEYCKYLIKTSLSNLGIHIEDNIINDIARNELNAIDILGDIEIIYNTINKSNKNEITNIVNKFKSQFEYLADKLSKFYPNEILDSYYKDGKLMFSAIPCSRITDIISKLSKDKSFLEKNFQKVAWFGYENGKFANAWLNDIAKGNIPKIVIQKYYTRPEKYLATSTKYGKNKSIEIKRMSKEDFLTSYVAMYYNGEHNAYYPIPNLADSGNQLYLSGKRYTKEESLENFTTLAIQEIYRIQDIYRRAETLDKKEKVKNYDIEFDKDGKIKKLGGAKFVFLPELNDFTFYEEGTNKPLTAEEMFLSENDNVTVSYISPITNLEVTNLNRYDLLKSAVNEILEKAYNDFIQEYNTLNTNLKGQLTKEFFYNQMYAYNSIVQLTVGDLAYYKASGNNTILDFQKRFKGIFGRTTRLAVNEEEEMSYLILDDEELKSEYYDALSKWVDAQKAAGIYSEADAVVIKATLEKIANTDGQGLISPRALAKVYRSMGNVSSELIEALEQASQTGGSINPTLLTKNLSIYFNPIKPFVQTNNIKPNHDGTGYDSIPTQIKNSEMLLLPIEALGGPLQTSPKLKALFRIMNTYSIDRIQFGSAVKSGLHGTININDLTDEDEIYNRIAEQIDNDVYTEEDLQDVDKDYVVEPGQSRQNILKKLPYSAYGIQTRTDANDEIATRGSQQSKTMMANLHQNEDYSLSLGKGNNINLNGNDIREAYIAASNRLVDIDSQNLDKEINDDTKLNHTLVDSLQNGSMKDDDMALGFTLNDNGEPIVPYNEPNVEQTTLNTLASITKKTITKRKTKGKALIQGSSFGVSNDLHAIFCVENNGKTIDITEDYYNKHIKKESKLSYIEWAKEQWVKGRLAIKHIEVYTPCYDEVIKRMLTDMETGKIDINKQVVNENGEKNNVLDSRLRNFIGYRIPTEGNCSMFSCYIKDFLPNCYGETILVPAEFIAITGSDFDIDKMFTMMYEHYITKDNRIVKRTLNKKQRESITTKEDLISIIDKSDKETVANLLIDMTHSILSSSNSLSRNLHPSSYPFMKNMSYYMSMLKGISVNEFNSLALTDIQKILQMKPSELEKLSDKYSKNLIPMTLQSILDIHENNNAGKTLIGMYAVATALHNVFMSIPTTCKFMNKFRIGNDSKDASNVYFTETFTHDIDRNGRLVSFNCGEYQASSVDNGKDPILYLLGQNPFTAPLANIMTLSGYTIDDVALFFNQPAIVAFMKEYTNQQNQGVTYPNVEEIVKVIKTTQFPTQNTLSVKALYTDTMINDIVGNKSEAYRMNEDFKTRQNQALDMLLTLNQGAEEIRLMSKFLRADTVNAGMPNSKAKLVKYALDYQKLKSLNIQIDGFNKPEKEDSIKKNRTIDYINNFINKGVLSPLETIIYKTHPQLKELINCATLLWGNSDIEHLSDDAIETLAEHILKYELDSYDFFKENADIKANGFAQHFDKLKAKHADYFNNNYFLKYFEISGDNLLFTIPDKSNKDIRELIKQDWEDMLYHEDNSIRNLALELFVYSYQDTHFNFTFNGFAQYIPTAIKEAMPGYLEYVRNNYGQMLNDENKQLNFLDQYLFKVKKIPVTKYNSNDKDVVVHKDGFMTIINKQNYPYYAKYNKGIYKLNKLENNIAYYSLMKNDNSGENNYITPKNNKKVNIDNSYKLFYGETFKVTDTSDGRIVVDKMNLC